MADLDSVRLELTTRIAAIDGRASSLRAGEMALAVDEIRHIAHHAGLNPTVTVAHFIEAALARGERGVLVHGWLQMLRDAVGAERQDVAACDSFAAACSIRLAA
ncbi:hypothetical protein [Sphingomonas sp.]|uniref:hypothetical protein n=1 Tax=Sphingomonas sp. TaxID=28214 RepID=UPI003B00C2E4